MKSNQTLSLILAVASFSSLSALAIPAGFINGTLITGTQANVNLTAIGTTDWALWGYGSGGASTSLAPDVSKSGGSAISDLTYLNPHSQPLRGIGQFDVNYGFSWTGGTPTASASTAYGGLQAYTSGTGNGVGEGFSFTVPAGTTEQELRVFVDVNVGVGQLIAKFSGGGATPYTNSAIAYGGNSPGEYVLDFAAPTTGTLDVQWTEISGSATQDNPAIFAVALSSVPEPSTPALFGIAAGVLAVFRLRRPKAAPGR